MKFLKHRIIVPESHSFQINKFDLSLNRDIIHSHNNFELNYIVNGRGRRFIGGDISLYEQGDLVLMGPNLPHGWDLDNQVESPICITTHFKEDLFDKKFFKIPEFISLQNLLDRSRLGLHFRNIDAQKIEKYLEDLRQMDGFESMIQILKIMGHLTTITDTQIISAPDFKWDPNQFEHERINKVLDYIFRNFNQRILLKDVAIQANLSETAFCTYFKKQTKKPFSIFLKEMRISYACKLLINEDEQNIAQICFDSGFNNLANFNRQFREITNLCPREYRKRYRIGPTFDGP